MTARELAQEMTNDEAAKIIGHTYISGMRAGKTQLEAALYKAIEALQERKTGKWVLAHPLQENDGGAYVCSCCKSGSYEVIPKTWKACPWCTALMEVDE